MTLIELSFVLFHLLFLVIVTLQLSSTHGFLLGIPGGVLATAALVGLEYLLVYASRAWRRWRRRGDPS